ncbi:hypothetical protein FJT64_026058 [Amphibalanus amphitrite]|uniref:Uncharacterized protein n=1 Tax=Amphibalanus amphitrite TaxID=1232801 RepID=A0A6A4W5N4_AMPAM|nr:hypothetical protein FJT64_026058 [Amphibalanus amphitrite]
MRPACKAVPRGADSPCGLPFSGLSLASAGRPGHQPARLPGTDPLRAPAPGWAPPPPPDLHRGVVRFVSSLDKLQPSGRAALAAPLPRHVSFPSYPEPVAEFSRSDGHVLTPPQPYEPPRPPGGGAVPQLRVTEDAGIAPRRLSSGPSYQQPTFSSLQKIRKPTEQQLETADWLLHRRGSGLTDSSRRNSAMGGLESTELRHGRLESARFNYG